MLLPNWPAPPNVKAISCTRLDALPLFAEIFKTHLLKQVHGACVLNLPHDQPFIADGAYTHHTNTPCVIKTADCLAILLCNEGGTEVAALHGGWRGLASGIVHEGVKRFQSPPHTLMAWLSPAICAQHYEVDRLVYQAFFEQDAILADCFKPTRHNHWQCDLIALAKFQLKQLGVEQIYGGSWCTFEDEAQFYSYRRRPSDVGRLLHAVWLEGSSPTF